MEPKYDNPFFPFLEPYLVIEILHKDVDHAKSFSLVMRLEQISITGSPTYKCVDRIL